MLRFNETEYNVGVTEYVLVRFRQHNPEKPVVAKLVLAELFEEWDTGREVTVPTTLILKVNFNRHRLRAVRPA